MIRRPHFLWRKLSSPVLQPALVQRSVASLRRRRVRQIDVRRIHFHVWHVQFELRGFTLSQAACVGDDAERSDSAQNDPGKECDPGLRTVTLSLSHLFSPACAPLRNQL